MLLNTGDLSSFKASGLKFVEGMQAISFYKRESFCHSCPSPEVYRVPSPPLQETGVPLKVSIRLQLNLFMKTVSGIT